MGDHHAEAAEAHWAVRLCGPCSSRSARWGLVQDTGNYSISWLLTRRHLLGRADDCSGEAGVMFFAAARDLDWTCRTVVAPMGLCREVQRSGCRSRVRVTRGFVIAGAGVVVLESGARKARGRLCRSRYGTWRLRHGRPWGGRCVAWEALADVKGGRLHNHGALFFSETPRVFFFIGEVDSEIGAIREVFGATCTCGRKC